ncbi:MAG: DUF3153 domain-containing protein [Leptolyngbyaceae cyanobacterium]
MRWLNRLGRIGLILSVLLLTGCLQYDLDIQFDSQTHGQFVQQIHWRGGEVANNPAWSEWVDVLRKRASSVDGSTHFLDDQTLEVVVPFNNGAELEAKFNQFFNGAKSAAPLTLPGGEPVVAHLSLRQGNWFGVISNHADLRFDLTAVPDLAETGVPLLQSQQLLTGRVTVTAPWVRSPTGDLSTTRTWNLVPGELNGLAADFWVPSPIGMGAAAIALLVLIGYALKYWLSTG